MTAILKKELISYYATMLAYVFMAIFCLISGLYFVTNNILAGSSSYTTVLSNVCYVMILVVPILTMRSFSEERRNRSDQLLFTSPVRLVSVLAAKYLAALIVLAGALCLTLVQVVILIIYGSPSASEIFVGYLGILLMGSAFISVGIFISSLSANQLTAAVATMGILLLFWMLDMLITRIANPVIGGLIGFFSVFSYFAPFRQCMLSLSSVVYLVSFTALFLFLTWVVIIRRSVTEGR